MNKEKMNELYELHDVVKMHPFRMSFDKKYLRSYSQLFRTLIEKLYNYLKRDNDINYKAVYMAYHDWNSAVFACSIHSEQYDSNNEYINHYLVYMDKVLGEIHHFLDFGNFLSVSTYTSKGTSLYREGYFSESDLIHEHRLSNKNEWVLYASKEQLQKYITIFSNIDNDIYKYTVEYYQKLYENYDENWS